MGADKKLFEKFNYNKVFVETGSFIGGGINQAYHAGYRKIISIELSEHYYDYCKNLFKNNEDVITLHHGDSGKILGKVISQINEPITFWLDGHYSGGAECGVPDTAGKDGECPLMKELDFIANHPTKNHVIMIDDIDRNIIEEIKDKISRINPYYRFRFATSEGFAENNILVAYA